MPNYTSEQVAGMLDISVRGVTKAALALGMTKLGRDWVFTDEDVERLRGRKKIPGRQPGPNARPRKRTKAKRDDE